MKTIPSGAVEVEAEIGSISLHEAVEALLEARLAIARVLEELPGEPIQRAADLEKALGLDRPLAWRVFRTATANEAAAALQHLPPMTTMARVLAEAQQRGVRQETIEEATRLLADFEERMKAVAGDRAGFSSLFSGHVKQGASAIEQRVRKAAFKNNAHLWGKQCRSLPILVAAWPSEDGSAMQSVTVRGWVDLHASRPDTPLVISSYFELHDGTTARKPIEYTRPGAFEIVPGFSEKRLSMSTITAPDNHQETLIRLGVGKAGRMSLFIRRWVDYVHPPGDPLSIFNGVTKPAEALLYDLMVPVGWSDPEKVKATAFARDDDPRTNSQRPMDEVPLYSDAEFMADVGNVPPTTDVPRWPDLVKHVLNERGRWGQRFELYRLRVPYPLLHSCIRLEVLPRS